MRACRTTKWHARRRQSRVVLTPRRWRQVLENNFSGMTVTTKPVTEESTEETVKTIARETPAGVSVNLW
jgi:hypothetical protein